MLIVYGHCYITYVRERVNKVCFKLLAGHNCPKLHHMATNFSPVTDSGLFSLCQAPRDTAGCKQITHLDIRGTTVRLRGALHCLQNLPDIHYLGFDSICDVIAKDIELRRKNGKEAKIYKFREICDDFLGTKPDSILSVCQWCPHVCKAVFTSGITDENFKAMSALKKKNFTHLFKWKQCRYLYCWCPFTT